MSEVLAHLGQSLVVGRPGETFVGWQTVKAWTEDTCACVLCKNRISTMVRRAERLARQDVLYLPKPSNVSFAVGMIGGCVSAGDAMPPWRSSPRSTPA